MGNQVVNRVRRKQKCQALKRAVLERPDKEGEQIGPESPVIGQHDHDRPGVYQSLLEVTIAKSIITRNGTEMRYAQLSIKRRILRMPETPAAPFHEKPVRGPESPPRKKEKAPSWSPTTRNLLCPF